MKIELIPKDEYYKFGIKIAVLLEMHEKKEFYSEKSPEQYLIKRLEEEYKNLQEKRY